MLYWKLTLRNVKRSMKEYMIFMITISISMMLLYAFQSLVYNEQLQQMLHRMDTLFQVILLVSGLLVFIIGWLISYVSGFIIKNRSKEFGLYMLSGMKRNTIACMFVLEMFLMGLAGFLIGCLLGAVFSQVLTAIVMNLFEGNYSFTLGFSWSALGWSFLCFLLMWIVTLFRERRRIMNISVHELLYEDRKNETSHHQPWLSWLILVLAFFSFGLGLYLTKKAVTGMILNENTQGLLPGILLLVVSMYCFYYGLSVLLDTLVMKHHQLKYQGNILVLYGHIKGRIQSNRIVLATLSLLMLLTLVLSSFAVKFQEATMAQIDELSPFDVHVMTANTIDQAAIKQYLNDKGYKIKDVYYHTYQFDQVESNLGKLLGKYTEYDKHPQCIRYSDYQRLLELKGKHSPPMKDGEYILLIRDIYSKSLQDKDMELNVAIGQETMQLATIDDTNLGQAMDDYLLVVPDAMVQHALLTGNRYAIDTSKETVVGMEEDLFEAALKDGGMIMLRVKADTIQRAMLSFMTLIFMLYYLAFIFICVSATIMAIQQMMDVSKQKYEYVLMRKLGMQNKEIDSCVRKQIAIYFFLPMLLPLFYLFPILQIMEMMFDNLSGKSSIYIACLLSLIIYFVIYFCYFLLAYFGCKKNLHLE